MAHHEEITLTLHGLDQHNRDVDGEVFAKKLSAFMLGLAAADIAANGKRRHKFFVAGLKKNTATASFREQVASTGVPPGSGISNYQRALVLIRDDEAEARVLPKKLVEPIARLNEGVGDVFAFGEVKTAGGIVVQIDKFLAERAQAVLADIEREERGQQTFFSGSAHTSFDGILKAVDLRGDHKKAILILTAGGIQIDCGVDRLDVEQLRAVLDRRATVYGLAKYEPTNPLPTYFEVFDVAIVPDGVGLNRWRGAFNVPPSDPDEDWEH